jgi:putative methionine-R-sulfoxide reductase with GAF domain
MSGSAQSGGFQRDVVQGREVNDADLTAKLKQAIAGSPERGRRAALAAAAIRRFGCYRWVGIYEVNSDEITVVGWDGQAPPVHSRFPRTEGLCGVAVAAREAVIVGDVAADPRYLTTHQSTRSEIIVPAFCGGIVVGLIDVESERPRAFAARDQQLLERCAAVIARLWGEDHQRGERRSPR